MKKAFGFIIAFCVLSNLSKAQIKLGLSAGMNMANEVSVFNNSALADFEKQASVNGLTGGLMLEAMIPIVGLGAEVSALYSHKGSNFKYDLNNPSQDYDISLEGTRSLHCIDIPLNLKWKIGLPKIAKVFVVGGWYWSYALGGNVEVNQAENKKTKMALPELQKEHKMDFSSSYDNMDQGLNFGFGVEVLEKVQVGAYYYISLKNTAAEGAISDMLNENYKYNTGDFDLSSNSRMFSVRLCYLF